jgi:hypothetical protein
MIPFLSKSLRRTAGTASPLRPLFAYRSFSSQPNEFQFTWKSFGVLAFGCSAAAAYYQIEQDERRREGLHLVSSRFLL